MAPKMWLYTLCTGEHTCGTRFASLLSISFTKTRLLSLSNIPEWTQPKRDCLGAVLLLGVVLLLVFSLPKCPTVGQKPFLKWSVAGCWVREAGHSNL